MMKTNGGCAVFWKKHKKWLNALLLAAIFVLTLWSVFGGEDLRQLVDCMQDAKLLYIVLSILCVVLFIVGESVVIAFLLQSLGIRANFGHCCLYSFIGFFYSCITPSASGGQPMQVVAMRKDRIPVAVSTVVLAIVTITYKLVLVVLGLAVMLIRPASVMPHLMSVKGLVWLGMALNVGCIALLLLLVFHPGLLRRGAEWLVRLVGRIRPFRHPEKIHASLEEMVSQYNGAADYYRSHKRVIAVVFLITLAQRAILFLITWLTYRAFGLQGESVLTILLLQAMISVSVDMLPLPGGMGISENLFLEIFEPVFGAALVLPGMVVSRGISYYTQLIISAVMTIASSFIIRDRN